MNDVKEMTRFTVENADRFKDLYFPIASEQGIKSSVTPNFSGDSKLDQNTFIMEPVSIENLHNNKSGRNFWCIVNHDKYTSLTGNSAYAEMKRFSSEDICTLEAGFMWQRVKRSFCHDDLNAEVLSFVPYDSNVEIFSVKITNTGSGKNVYTPIAAVPLYGRSADNIRDHRHVTSLLGRITTNKNTVLLKPTLSFDERGHQKNNVTYFVAGLTDDGSNPVSFYPTVDSFVGEGSFLNPEAVAKDWPGDESGKTYEGQEAVGAIRFADVQLEVGQSKDFIIIIGATEDETEIQKAIEQFGSVKAVEDSLKATEEYWNSQVNISVKTGNRDFDEFMRWVCFQPFLRRIYGCSFLPHHDYGRGGRGWRDLWQDCLALLIMNPSGVRKMILDNFGGVRVDGTNATIIGNLPGEFKADRNGITRVWMDHGMWPFLTTELYLEQEGDLELLLEKVCYFKDRQINRGLSTDEEYAQEAGCFQQTKDGKIFCGTVLEHILLEHVMAILETGDHGIIRLRDADWNDALDMASAKGESVAFSCAYAGNLKRIASYIKELGEKGHSIELMEEFVELLNEIGPDEKANEVSFREYLKEVSHSLVGKTKAVDAGWLAQKLESLAETMMERIRTQEWVGDGKNNHWVNSYYDNSGKQVEGQNNLGVRMMLTGQVFSIMSGTATDEMTESIIKAADKYLYEKEVGGYRLNTNFHENKFDMGRAFGFSYGDKENGAVFSHMTVMYAYALYLRGFAKEGYKALQTLADAAMNFETSHIYPGVPEYFNNKGRGLYHYLTGAASWYALTMVTQVFGVKGENGNLSFSPKLMKEQFDEEGKASISLMFKGKAYEITYLNKDRLGYDDYEISDIKSEQIDDVNKILITLKRRED